MVGHDLTDKLHGFSDTEMLYCICAREDIQHTQKKDWVITGMMVKQVMSAPLMSSYDQQHVVVVGELTVETMPVPEQLPSNDDNDMHRVKQDVCDYWREQRQQEENLDRKAEAEKTPKRRRRAQQKAGLLFDVGVSSACSRCDKWRKQMQQEQVTDRAVAATGGGGAASTPAAPQGFISGAAAGAATAAASAAGAAAAATAAAAAGAANSSRSNSSGSQPRYYHALAIASDCQAMRLL